MVLNFMLYLIANFYEITQDFYVKYDKMKRNHKRKYFFSQWI